MRLVKMAADTIPADLATRADCPLRRVASGDAPGDVVFHDVPSGGKGKLKRNSSAAQVFGPLWAPYLSRKWAMVTIPV